MGKSWPVKYRYADYIIVAFYSIAFMVIYLIEIEQLTVADPSNFNYPLWPPAYFVDLAHWWGEHYHPTLYFRPLTYKLTVWPDMFISGPVYLFGCYAFLKKKAWIKYPAMIQAIMLLVIMIYSYYAEMAGPYPSTYPGVLWLSMIIWVIVPMLIIWRCKQIAR